MANKLDPMDIIQSLSLLNDGFGNCKVDSTLEVSRNTVSSCVSQLKANFYTFIYHRFYSTNREYYNQWIQWNRKELSCTDIRMSSQLQWRVGCYALIQQSSVED